MDFAESAEDAAFRDELRTWLDERLPKFLTEWSDPDGEAAAAPGATGVMRSM